MSKDKVLETFVAGNIASTWDRTSPGKISQDQIESIVDLISLRGVLEMLADVARLKAEHIRSDWQDEPSAKVWDDMATKLDDLSWCPV